MQRCSYFIENKALFGSFPDQTQVSELEHNGVRIFIDLTVPGESKTSPYTTKYQYINYPIEDHKIPTDWISFSELVITITNLIKKLEDDEKIYIHCKGGHGRSGIVVACILCYYYGISPNEALQKTTHFHSRRPEMQDKWRRIGSPQGKRQKDFVHRFFHVIRYNENFYQEFENTSKHTVTTSLGTFPTAQLAFLAYKAPNNEEYISKLIQGEVMDIDYPEDWEEKKVQHMLKILDKKFHQHQDLKKMLLNTGLKPLVKDCLDLFWGNGSNRQGKNIHGKILQKVREQLYIEN